ncbi:MAG: polysaccharide deacetylase family protein [Clostridia bacterium]
MKKQRVFFCLFIVLFCFINIFSYNNHAVAINKLTPLTTVPESIKLAVVMYHSILKSKTGRYFVSPNQLENDIIALKKAGYQSVLSADILNFVNNHGTLPSKPIYMTFDDGHYNCLYYGLPILKKHNFKAVFNIVGAYSEHSSTSGDCDNPNYSHLTWAEIDEINKSGYVEIGNHSYNMHKFNPRFGIGQNYNENDDDYIMAITNDVVKLNSKLQETNVKTNVFAYPFGKYSTLSEKVLADLGFNITLTCNEGISVLKRNNPECTKLLKRINREGSYSTYEFVEKINNFANKTIL